MIVLNENVKQYLWKEFRCNNIPKYHKYFDEWLENLTDDQIKFYTAYSEGKKTPGIEIEIWRQYPLNPEYEVSNLGNVRKDDKVLKLYPQKSGYVNVWIGNVATNVHRLVAMTWLGMDGYMTEKFVDHMNTVRSDNRVCNLRWATPKENANNPVTLKNRKKKLK